MQFVVDSNIIISAIISFDGKTRELLFSDKFLFFAPEFLLAEIKKHEKEILKKSGLNKSEFELALSLVSSRIIFVSFVEFKKFISKAEQVCPDENDVEFFALALSKNIPLWSNYKKLKNQPKVKVVSIKELIQDYYL
ncbi:MAG: PIN domain-containing protein [Candidatus Diapherotrites archaeon]